VPTPGGPRPSQLPARHLREVADQVQGVVHDPSRADPAVVAPQTLVSGVSLGSGTVRPGDLYAALPGQRVHGADFAGAARAAGAVAVLTDPAGAGRALATGLPVIVVEEPRARLGSLAAWLYGRPAERLLTLGVTGTNGKTTTTFLLDGALRRLGRRTGLVGTIELRVDTEVIPATGTTPEAPDLHALFAVMVEHGVDVCSMEISSHALAQHRVDGLTVDVAGFTNLSQDHLDYHHTMDEYFAAKSVLFTPQFAHRAVVCIDDGWGRRLAARLAVSDVPVVTVGSRPPAGAAEGAAAALADWQVTSTAVREGTTVARLRTPAGDALALSLPLPGDFNVANGVLALAMLVEAGFGAHEAAIALAGAGPVPGRMERVSAAEPGAATGEPLAVVDYAHTPDAVSAALNALRQNAKPLVVVLGAGGDRDRDKRPLMGGAAAAVADVVVVTDDNPRSEDPAAIRAAVLAGARERAGGSGALVIEISGRRAAIAEAVSRAWSSEGTGVVLVAGKGHEQGQDVAGTVHPFDDRAVLRQALDEQARLADQRSPS